VQRLQPESRRRHVLERLYGVARKKRPDEILAHRHPYLPLIPTGEYSTTKICRFSLEMYEVLGMYKVCGWPDFVQIIPICLDLDLEMDQAPTDIATCT
jgi:hypothetical protein